MTPLGPRTVTVHHHHGPADGHTWPLHRDAGPMPERLGHLADPESTGYIRSHAVFSPDGTETWHYRWEAPHSGIRRPCSNGDERGCGGGRCPSGRSRQTA